MRYVCLIVLMSLCLMAGCPASSPPKEGGEQERTQETTKDASTDTTKDDVTADTTKDDATTDKTKDDVAPDATKDDTTPDATKDDTTPDTTKDDTTPDPVKPDDNTEPGNDGTTEPTTDGGTEPTPDMTADVVADTTPDATPETPAEGPGDITAPDTAGLTCTERSTRARSHVDTAINANLACTATTDCTSVSTSTDCYGACLAAVNNAGKTKVQDAIKQVNQWWCKDYRKDGCPYATPRCANVTIVCDQKTCKTMDCTARRTSASKTISDIRNANLSCTQDSDCTLVFTSTDCAGACQVSVNQQGATKLKAAILDINATTCANYRNDGCPYASPSCAAVKAVCKSGQCGTAPPN